MSNERRELTKDVALNILKGMKNAEKTGVPYKGVEVASVGYNDSEGKPFTYPSGDQYAIVNLKAQTPHQQREAAKLFVEGDYQGACNQNITVNMSPDKAAEALAVGFGTLTTATVWSDNLQQDITVGRRFVPAASIDITNTNIEALIEKMEEVGETA